MITRKSSKSLWMGMVFLLGSLTPGHAVNRVFLLGGQSNMVGQGINTELVSPYSAPQNDVNYWNGDWVLLSPGFGNGPGYFGPEVAFGRAIKDALPGDTIYLIKYAVNGTALYDDWSPTNGPQYIGFMNTVNAALANLDTNGINYEISGMLWMQGESDAYEGEAASYETNLTNFINVMRTEFSTPQMPFIIARVLDYFGGDTIPLHSGTQTDPNQAEVVRAAQVSVAESAPYISWFDTDSYQLGNDLGHYGTQGQLDLGNAFAAAILAPPAPAIGVTGSDLLIRWESMVGATYTLFGNSSLASNPVTWSIVESNIAAALPDTAITIPIPVAPAMFYIAERNEP